VHTPDLHHAAWVVPVSQPVIEDGAVAVDGSRIVDVGDFRKMRKRYPKARLYKHDNRVLLPPLINTHSHLELSHLHLSPEDPPAGFTGWIERLITTRERVGATGPEAEKTARAALLKQHELGVIAIGDIGNTDIGLQVRRSFPGILIHFCEVLGRSAKTRRAIHKKLQNAPDSRVYTVHAPYSTHPELIRSVKDRSRRLGHPFSIHAAEPESENDMICSGSGDLFDFLFQRGFIEKSYTPPAASDRQGSIHYLDSLGVLDKLTLCVHCIHVSPEEVQILAEREAKVCLCPGSNRYLKVGKAPVQLFLDHGILPALGTDSRASNPELSIWREMRLLKQENPGLRPSDILAMATMGGAVALGLSQEHGSLAPGRKSQFLSVELPRTVKTEKAVLEFLVTGNEKIIPEWIQ
jgi:cytosine/adenosine deaminase-related metal-dependent hydrolase